MNLFQQLHHDRALEQTRRHFLSRSSMGLASMWLGGQAGGAVLQKDPARPLAPDIPHLAPKAKRVIFMHMAGAPSQLELFDHKQELTKYDGKDCPQEFVEGKQFAFIQGVPKMLGSVYPFHQAGKSGAWISDRMPHFEKMIDEVCFIKSMWSDQFNHAPAQLLLQTGSQLSGSPAAGAWATYGLGSENENLPGFIVLTSGGKNPDAGKAVWGSGYLPSVYQGVQCRSQGDPVLFLGNPDGVSRSLRRRTLDALNEVNQRVATEYGDPETMTRIAQYEMAFRMQIHASDAFDISQEDQKVHEDYATEPGKESFANNCLLARRLAERGVRFIQLFDWGWDSHGTDPSTDLTMGFADKCREIDQPIGALLRDLKQRGLLEETLVVWSGEFGRTPMRENRGGTTMKNIGRDHGPAAYTLWMAGGGVKPGFSYGETDPLGYEAVVDKVSAHDFHATLMTLLGFDHKRLTYPFQGLEQRLTNVTKHSRVVKEVIA
ncbi:MAG: DUF1501 domain-containing protein [Verrucomicrobiota bacterium]